MKNSNQIADLMAKELELLTKRDQLDQKLATLRQEIRALRQTEFDLLLQTSSDAVQIPLLLNVAFYGHDHAHKARKDFLQNQTHGALNYHSSNLDTGEVVLTISIHQHHSKQDLQQIAQALMLVMPHMKNDTFKFETHDASTSGVCEIILTKTKAQLNKLTWGVNRRIGPTQPKTIEGMTALLEAAQTWDWTVDEPVTG